MRATQARRPAAPVTRGVPPLPHSARPRPARGPATALWLAAALLGGCLPDDAPVGLRRTPAGQGPRIWFDMQAGIVPFPNDLLTLPDPTLPSGRRLNVSLAVPTATEARLRRAALDIDGFGTFSALTVRFEAPLDVAALDGRNRASSEDPVLVLDLTSGSTFGERIPLDLGRGAFPVTLPDRAALFPLDPRAGAANLVFETVDEDRDGDGKLSPREDTDGDGVLDKPNVITPGGDPVADLATFYERETHTLILRPLVPLRPGHHYAVVLTNRVRGVDGQPVRSPFQFIHHTRQTAALEKLGQALGPHGVSLDDVAFTWALTTQSATTELASVRDGLLGQGPYAELGTRYPPDVSVDPLLGADVPEAALLRTERLVELVEAITPHVFPGASPEVLADSFTDVDYLVAGRFVTPDLVDPQVGRFLLQPKSRTNRVAVVGAQVPFWCVVPRATGGRVPPFPVVLFAHDLGESRLQSLLFAGMFARWGLATCALDLVDHGVAVSAGLTQAIERVLGADAPMVRVLAGLRAVDVDGDGTLDPGVRIFGLDVVKTRAVMQQAAVDMLQLLRVVRSFDGTRRWSLAGIDSAVAGDFDGDGRVDLGGPNVAVHLTGVGFGGMVAGILAGLDPGVQSYAPVAAGGGLADMLRRGGLKGMRERLLLPLMGPFIAGFPRPSGFTEVTVLTPGAPEEGVPIARLPPLVPGDRVRLTNGRNGLVREAVVDDEGAFRVAVPTNGPEVVLPVDPSEAPAPDAPPPQADALVLQVFDVSGQPRNTIDHFEDAVLFGGTSHTAGDPLVALAGGWGLQRQTPGFHAGTDILQISFEAADPINHVRDLAARTPMMLVATLGDPVVPVATTLALARSAGLLNDTVAPGADAVLLAQGVAEGVAWRGPLTDPEGIGPAALGLPRSDPPLSIISADGHSALRLVPVSAEGAHGVIGPLGGAGADPWRYLSNLLGRYFATGEPGHLACLWTASGPQGCP